MNIRKFFLPGLSIRLALFLTVSLSLPVVAFACGDKQPLPQIALTLNADQWLTSSTANVTVVGHALLTQEQLANAQKNILQALQKISADGTWHIVQMQRSQSQANLEQLEVTAEARLLNSAITDLRSKAKAVSKQGETYEIGDIDYSPTDAEINTAQADLRAQIYQAAKAELQRISQLYPEQQYYLFSVNFNGSASPPVMYQKAGFAEMSATAVAPGPTPATGANVSQHLRLAAQVVLSANPMAAKTAVK